MPRCPEAMPRGAYRTKSLRRKCLAQGKKEERLFAARPFRIRRARASWIKGMKKCSVLLAFLLFLYGVARIPLKLVAKSLKPIIPIIIFTAILNVCFMPGVGQPLVHWGFLKIYREGVTYAVMIVVRIVCLIAGTSLLTYTTSPIVLTDAIERLLRPLAKLHLPVHELAMMMTIALRFIPLLIEETEKIMNAQKARGALLDSGTLTQRVKALVPVLIPLFISAFRRADELATAMECRCYHGGEGRTRLKTLRLTAKDWLLSAVCVAVLCCIACSGALWARFWG